MADTPITDYNRLSKESQATIATNAKSLGITPQEYLTSRGGVYKSGYYGDTPEFRRLSDEAYFAAAQKGTEAINTAKFNQIKEAYQKDPNLIEDPYLRLAYQNKVITLDELMEKLSSNTSGKRGFGTLLKGRGLNSIGALADGTPLYGWDAQGKPVTDAYGTVYSTTSPSDAIAKASSGANPIGFGSSTATATATATATSTMTSAQQDVYSTIVDRLNRYNLGGLAPLIKKLAIEGATEATIMLRLQDEPIYQERFKANQSRISKGLKALTPAEYLTLEDDYRQVLRAYGLKQFDNDAYVSQFLANDISVSELSNRVVTAVQRVQNADPAVSSMLKNYYGITNNDLVAYVLDPNQQFQKIERQVAASEIGVAAGRQGFNIGVPVAEQLAAQGITQAEAQRGYATIADILPTAEKLSDIYGTTLESYGLAEGEQEVFNQLASAQRKRQRLVSREVAEFSGQAGVGRGSLGTATGGQY